VFLLASGWRAGSTLLQRMIMSSGELFLWGEPYAHCGLIECLSESMRPLAATDWPWAKRTIGKRDLQNLGKSAIANLYPEPEHLLGAHRSFFLAAYRDPALKAGCRRWGLKEVRLGAEHAFYLRTLFPEAQFLLLHRNPYSAWRSYRAMGRDWFRRWPEQPIITPRQFGEMWVNLTSGFLTSKEDLGALVVAYEDVRSESTVGKIADYLECPIDSDPLGAVIGSSRTSSTYLITRAEENELRKVVDPLAKDLGYLGPGS